jgi:hypothetical protein
MSDAHRAELLQAFRAEHRKVRALHIGHIEPLATGRHGERERGARPIPTVATTISRSVSTTLTVALAIGDEGALADRRQAAPTLTVAPSATTLTNAAELAKARRTSSPAASASSRLAPGRTAANSSPPSLATMVAPSSRSDSFRANSFSTTSPASWRSAPVGQAGQFVGQRIDALPHSWRSFAIDSTVKASALRTSSV